MEEVQKIPDTVLNSLPGDQGAPHIVSVSFAGVRSEVLLHALEERGFRYLPVPMFLSLSGVSVVFKKLDLKKICWILPLRFGFSVRIQQKKSWNTACSRLGTAP